MKVVWLSAGVSSFVSGYLVKDTVDKWIYIDIKDQHPDSIRFIYDCEKTIGKRVEILKSDEFQNNNCVGCVKGGMGYWNKIRKDFPDVFEKRARLEREIGHSCLKQYFLDELPPDAGRMQKEVMEDCGIMCYIAENRS